MQRFLAGVIMEQTEPPKVIISLPLGHLVPGEGSLQSQVLNCGGPTPKLVSEAVTSRWLSPQGHNNWA